MSTEVPRRLRVVATGLLILVAACGRSGTAAAPGPTASPSPTSTTDSLADDADQLAAALLSMGVNINGVQPAIVRLGDAKFCGSEAPSDEAPHDRALDEPSRRCFIERYNAHQPAVFVLQQFSVEGDPIVTIYRSNRDGSLNLDVDATKDKFGSGTWQAAKCSGITTDFPNAPEPLPDYYFEADGCGDFTEKDRGERVAITGMANLAVKVADLDAACAFYERSGAEVRDRMHWNNGERADVFLGPVMITLFTHAIYEDAVELPSEGFLHPALFTDDLDAELRGHTVLWGPEVVEGAFGKRRIAFVAAPGNIRLEFMEQLEPPADESRNA